MWTFVLVQIFQTFDFFYLPQSCILAVGGILDSSLHGASEIWHASSGSRATSRQRSHWTSCQSREPETHARPPPGSTPLLVLSKRAPLAAALALPLGLAPTPSRRRQRGVDHFCGPVWGNCIPPIRRWCTEQRHSLWNPRR